MVYVILSSKRLKHVLYINTISEQPKTRDSNSAGLGLTGKHAVVGITVIFNKVNNMFRT